MRTARESYLNQSRLLPKKALPTRRSSFPAVLVLLPSRWPIGLTQLIEFVRVAGATEVEVLIPTGGYSQNEQRCSSNVTFGIGTPRIALQIVCAHWIFC